MFDAKGEICFIDAQISGSFECHSARMRLSEASRRDTSALLCSRMRVEGSILLYKDFEAKGEVAFRRANVGGNFDASHATIRSKGGKALSCEGMHVTGAVLLGSSPSTNAEDIPQTNKQDRHFKAFGAVDFSGAIVEGDFDCEGGHFINARPKEMSTPPKGGDAIRCDEALKLRRTVIGGALKFGKAPGSGRHPVCWGTLDLRDARVAVLVDDAEAWKIETIREGSSPEDPKKQTNELRCYVLLDGFTYDQIGGDSPLDAKNRSKWLGREQEFKPQPYEQLIKVLRAMGKSSEAVHIAIEKERRDPPKKLMNRSLWRAWSIIGYGYLWSRVFYLSIVIWFACGVAYYAMNSYGWVRFSAAAMDYTLFEKCSSAQDKLIAARWKRDTPVTDNDLKTETKLLQTECPQFSAFKLSADAMLPIMGLGERRYWAFKVPEEIDSIALPVPGGIAIEIPIDRNNLPELLDMLFTLEMLFGWVFGVSLGIVLSQKINRE